MDYLRLLERLYPESVADIKAIISKMKIAIEHMAVLYGIDNPNFKDLRHRQEISPRARCSPGFRKFFRFDPQDQQDERTRGRHAWRSMSDNRSLVDVIDHIFSR